MKKNIMILSVIGCAAVFAVGAFVFLKNKSKDDSGQTDTSGIVINEENFPDEFFRQYILSDIDTDHDGFLSEEETAVTEMSISAMEGFEDLTGIEYFKSLEKLSISGYNGTRINVDENQYLSNVQIAYCRNLVSLSFKGESYDLINIYGCGKLESIQLDTPNLVSFRLCEENRVKTLDVSSCKEMQELTIDAPLFSLDLSEMKNHYIENSLRIRFFLTGTHQIEAADNTINLKENDPNIDLSKISNLTNATIDSEGTLRLTDQNVKEAKYTYDCGNGFLMNVTICFKA